MNLYSLRKEYTLKILDEKNVFKSPYAQFEEWFKEAVRAKVNEPNVMTLATVDENCKPSARIVLLKSFDKSGLVFFTNYESKKGKQLFNNPNAALVFYWLELERQVRIAGIVEKLNSSGSDEYFRTRPHGSKIGAWASPQSNYIPDRLHIEKLYSGFKEKFKSGDIPRPENWGGYSLKANLFEFWQGRRNRLHDRIEYSREGDTWTIRRLAP